MRKKHEMLVLQNGGQMSVELAVMLPVVLVVGLTIANIMAFLNACARFDRACLDAVIAHGVSPAGMQSELSAVGAVQESLEEVFAGNDAVSIEVSVEPISDTPSVLMTLCPHLARYRCTMRYRPWPQHLRIAGAAMDAPFEIVHTKSLVIDRYRPGVVV